MSTVVRVEATTFLIAAIPLPSPPSLISASLSRTFGCVHMSRICVFEQVVGGK